MKKKVVLKLLLLGALLAAMAIAQEEDDAAASEDYINNGGVESLRGRTALNREQMAGDVKRFHKDRSPVARSYVHQPPVIPHSIRGYRVDLRSNKCLSCHSWRYARESGATKVSPTHFETRDGITLSDVSPGRYFCSQCHVPQADAAPLIENEFQPVESLLAR